MGGGIRSDQVVVSGGYQVGYPAGVRWGVSGRFSGGYQAEGRWGYLVVWYPAEPGGYQIGVR